jgi:Lar family restriction alleviation protein
MTPAKPCPFCGAEEINVMPGETFRWVFAYCQSCGARAGEVRVNTMADDQGKAKQDALENAIKAWNVRVSE